MRSKSRIATSCFCSLAVAAVLGLASQAQAQLKLSQVYGIGGGTAAAPNGDFVEIFNASCATVNLDDYSVQISSASTTTTWTVVNLPAFNLMPGQYYLIRLETSATGTTYVADLTTSPAITSMASTGGKAAIVLGNTSLAPVACPPQSAVIDLFTYSSTTGVCTEGTRFFPNSAFASGISYMRNGDGCVDTDNNLADFSLSSGIAVPRNSSSALNVCAPPLSPNYGACTFPTTCLVMTEAQCDTAAGIYGGDCVNCPLPGACCQPNGVCAILQQSACEALGVGAVFQGDPSCPPATPCAESGKCCSPDGTTCAQLVEIACAAPNVWSPGTCTISYLVNTECPPNFTDISQTGTELLGWTSVDDSAITVTLPFTFKFYGVDRTSASVGTNGYLVFNPPAGAASSIPPDAPLSLLQQNNSVYVYGEDLQLRGTGADPIGSVKHETFGTSPNQVFIVQWTNVDLFSPSQPDGQRNTFQVKLYESSGVVEMQYLSLNTTGLSPVPNDVVIGVRETNANFTEVSQSVVGVGPKALIFAPTGGCSTLLAAGSCCIPNEPCSVLAEAACQLACGIYQGDGTDCTSAPCVTEACCLPQGGCVDVLVAVCAGLNGVAQGPASTCAGVNCPPAGRCCTATGACSVTLQANCQASGSNWVQGGDCTTLPCILGACCAADGSCSQLTEAGCTAANGIRWTASTPCTPNLCQGRCCAPDGTCSITAFNACVAPNIYGGDGSACSPSNVCQGRCCLPNGTCSVTGSGGCADIGGTFTIGLDCSNTTIFSYAVSMVMNDPDVGGTPVSNVQTVTGLTGNITDLDVDMAALHSWVGDVRIQVEHLGVIAIIYDRPGVINEVCCGCAQNDFDIILDDEGTGGTIEATCNATAPSALSPPNFVPNVALSVYDGMDPNGDWTITAADVEPAGADTGTLTRWSLHISTAGDVCPVVGCTCFGDMNGDSTVDGEDINGFTACITGGGGNCACANMDHVGGADANDVDEFVAALLAGTCGAP